MQESIDREILSVDLADGRRTIVQGMVEGAGVGFLSRVLDQRGLRTPKHGETRDGWYPTDGVVVAVLHRLNGCWRMHRARRIDSP